MMADDNRQRHKKSFRFFSVFLPLPRRFTDGVARRITPDTAIVIPRGAERAMRVLSAPFAYLTCHRQRARLWPAPARRS